MKRLIGFVIVLFLSSFPEKGFPSVGVCSDNLRPPAGGLNLNLDGIRLSGETFVHLFGLGLGSSVPSIELMEELTIQIYKSRNGYISYFELFKLVGQALNWEVKNTVTSDHPFAEYGISVYRVNYQVKRNGNIRLVGQSCNAYPTIEDLKEIFQLFKEENALGVEIDGHNYAPAEALAIE